MQYSYIFDEETKELLQSDTPADIPCYDPVIAPPAGISPTSVPPTSVSPTSAPPASVKSAETGSTGSQTPDVETSVKSDPAEIESDMVSSF